MAARGHDQSSFIKQEAKPEFFLFIPALITRKHTPVCVSWQEVVLLTPQTS